MNYWKSPFVSSEKRLAKCKKQGTSLSVIFYNGILFVVELKYFWYCGEQVRDDDV
jgi:hypothetical protein